ncbi:MAG TPA: ATP synthase F1 subunit epsilon [Anaerovoracaceae bacterium]|nr:ATP synthase F1 subunit epsilon [Anaerovoracaceae bacterium]
MAKTFKLEVITPERLFYEGDVEMVIVRTTLGYEGFLANHAWACKLLGTGIMRLKEAGESKFKHASITGGFIDVKDRVTIFTDAAEWPEEIDIDRQERKLEQARGILEDHSDDKQIQLAKLSIEKALNRVKLRSEMFDK